MTQALERIRLHHLEGPRAGQIDEFCQPSVVVGRAADCHLVFATERGVSGHHCEIRQANGAFELVDSNSTNGTFVGDDRIGTRVLKNGDQVRFGYMGPLVRVEIEVLAQPMHADSDAGASSTMMFSARRINEAASAAPPEVTLPPPSRAPAPPPVAPTPPSNPMPAAQPARAAAPVAPPRPAAPAAKAAPTPAAAPGAKKGGSRAVLWIITLIVILGLAGGAAVLARLMVPH